jgi:glucuronoarabinoxylan endo-1,4-beta-xylanase
MALVRIFKYLKRSMKQTMKEKWMIGTSALLLMSCVLISSCGGDDENSEPEPEPPGPKATVLTIDPAVTHQEMVGFGGALTWYSNWVTNNSKKTEIADLIFDDLGIDIIRFKNWYYPDDYPTVKSTAVMNDDGSKNGWDATNELYTMAKSRNPNVKILLSSWGPPAALKSNNQTREGTLAKDEEGKFVYDAYADYWGDVFDNLPFNPDYLSIQNEPTYLNSGWTTCQWGAAESFALPDYNIAFDKVWDKIKNRANPPVMIGPESQDVPTFAAFANILKNKAHCGMLAYHPYNINSGTSSDATANSLSTIGTFTTKPNIMTEFSDNLNWFNTALFIQTALTKANSSGYIYWKLVWATPATGTDAGMVSVPSSGGTTYTVTPFYHLIKHFSKHIDAGYKRINASASALNLSISGFKNADGKKITLVVVNKGAGTITIDPTPTGKTITAMEGYQSKEGSYYQTLDALTAEKNVDLPAQSITTLVLTVN